MIKIDTVDVSLYKAYSAGKMTLHEVAIHFCICGRTIFVDDAFAKRKMKEIEDRINP